MSGRLIDLLGLVAALYLYFNSLITVDKVREGWTALWCLYVSVGVAGVSTRSVIDVTDVSMQSMVGDDGVDRRDERFRQALQRNTTPQPVKHPLGSPLPWWMSQPADRLRLSVAPLTLCASCHKSGSDQLRWNPGPVRLLTDPWPVTYTYTQCRCSCSKHGGDSVSTADII